MEQKEGANWKTQLMLFGVVAGALVGAGRGIPICALGGNGAGRHSLAPRPVKPVAAVSVGLSVLGLLRQIAGLGLED